MTRQPTTRNRSRSAPFWGTAAALLVLLAPSAQAATRFPEPQQAPAPIERRPPPNPGTADSQQRRGVRGEHLAEWMTQHSNLSPQQQQKALEREPGFQSLPQQTQQRMRQRLAQLDAMPPDQRQRRLAHIEAMERLSPDQRAEVRGTMAQLGSLPQDQRRTVAQTFRALRDLPPEQRIQAYGSGRFGQPLNDADRNVLFNLLRVEPMLEPTTSGTAPNTQGPR